MNVKGKIVRNTEKRAQLAVVFSMLFILVVGLLVGSDYGPGCDQDTETRILFMNLRAYARLVLDEDSGYLQSLGTDDVTTDVERDHGASALYPAALFSAIPAVRSDPRVWLRAYRWCVFFFF